MDLLFKQLVNEQFDQLSETEIDDLEQLLNEADLDIVDWIMGRQPIPREQYQGFVEHMQTLHERHLAEN